jgi:probable addiction module antidote protein
MAIETRLWDPVEHLAEVEDQIRYLEAAFEDGDPAVIAAAFGDVARARGMSGIAKGAGVTRDALYKSLTKDGDPRLSTLMGVIKALGVKITIAAP